MPLFHTPPPPPRRIFPVLFWLTPAGVLRTDDYFATSFMIGPKGFDLLVQDRHVVFLTHEQVRKHQCEPIQKPDTAGLIAVI